MSSDNPERIREILKRVFEDLEKQYGKKTGGWLAGLSGGAPISSGPATSSGEDKQHDKSG